MKIAQKMVQRLHWHLSISKTKHELHKIVYYEMSDVDKKEVESLIIAHQVEKSLCVGGKIQNRKTIELLLNNAIFLLENGIDKDSFVIKESLGIVSTISNSNSYFDLLNVIDELKIKYGLSININVGIKPI
jgi:hypothetical protein